MANLTPTFRAAQYEPSGVIYNYIYSIQTQIPEWTDFEVNVLESNGYNKQYPSTYCNNKVFGSGVTVLDSVITYQGGGNYYNPVMNNPKLYEDTRIDLAYPVLTMYQGGATKFTSEMEFGIPQGDTIPSLVMIKNDIANHQTIVEWYKNGALAATDVIGLQFTDFVLAIAASGNTITGYSYIFTTDIPNTLWTSGLKSTPEVLNILNTGGYAGSNESAYGFTDEELGEFVMSKIFDYQGNDAYTGNTTATITGAMPAVDELLIEDLTARCENYGGWLGTDLVEYMGGWNYILEMANNGTPVEVKIPTAVEGEYAKITYDFMYGSGPYFCLYDADDNLIGYITTSVYERQIGKVFLTWYKQSDPMLSATRFLACYVRRNGYGTEPTWYQLTDFSLQNANVEWEEFDNLALLEDLIEGYDPNSGQEDEKQEEPEDVEDPANDPLATGFLYAFMVDSTDMLNLADALVPDTLAQKLKADFGNNLFEFIVSYHMMPCLTNASSLNKTAIAYRGTPFLYGANNTQLMLSPITKSWYKVNCGSKVCMPQGCRQDGFENWAHANVQLYLPFIGFVHLNTADVWNKTISIVYTFDILQGTCVANVGVGNNGTIYSYEGICKYAIPFTTAVDKSNQELLSGIFSSAGAAVSIGGVVAGAASPTALMGAAGGIANAAGSFISAAEHKSVINRGGCLSGAPGWNMPRKPALIITVPDAIRPGMIYNDTTGYPCFETGQLSSWQNNYVEIASIDLKANINSDGSVPNDNELDMINSTLKGGVYV